MTPQKIQRTALRRDAAATLRRVTDALALPPNVAAYLRGYADGLEGRRPPKRGERASP